VKIRFSRDPETELSRCQTGVTEEEVAEVLERPGEDRAGADGSRVAMGRAGSGRYLRVIYVAEPEPDSVYVITAYELRGKPLMAYIGRRLGRRK